MSKIGQQVLACLFDTLCRTCCMVTCGWALMCCWGLRTPGAYLYWGTPRIGAAAAVGGRRPIVWAAARRGTKTLSQTSSSHTFWLYFLCVKTHYWLWEGNLQTRWADIMRGTWGAGRMVLKAWGRGAEGRMAPGMFWKSTNKHDRQMNNSFCLNVLIKWLNIQWKRKDTFGHARYSRCGRTPPVVHLGLGRSGAIWPAAG